MKILLKTDHSSLESVNLASWIPEMSMEALERVLQTLPYVEKPRITVFGHETKQPRDVLFLSDESTGYNYSRQLMPAVAFTPETAILRELMAAVNRACGASFNGMLINRYNTGTDCIGAHSDDERGVDASAGVVSISFGATRLFRIKDKKDITSSPYWDPAVERHALSARRFRYDVPLKHGHVVCMKGDFQKEFTHEVPVQKKVTGVRYNITFRCHTK